MRAVIQRQYGTSEQLSLGQLEAPTPGKGEVLLQVRAAGLDRGTWHLMTGEPYLARLAFGLRAPKNPIPGRDVAGIVASVGEGVTDFAPGDGVFGTATSGSFAELAVAPVTQLARKPAALTFEQAAALPISGGTALQAVRNSAKVEPGQRVLVLGASGGVGSYAVQIAAADGAEVTGMASAAKADLVHNLGASRMLDYAHDQVTDGAPYDVILDIAGQRPLRQLRQALTPNGTLVIIGGEGGGRWLGGVQRQLWAVMLSPFVGQRLTGLVSTEKAEHFEILAGLVEKGAVQPLIHRAYPLSEAAQAMADLEAGRIGGKAVITI